MAFWLQARAPHQQVAPRGLSDAGWCRTALPPTLFSSLVITALRPQQTVTLHLMLWKWRGSGASAQCLTEAPARVRRDRNTERPGGSPWVWVCNVCVRGGHSVLFVVHAPEKLLLSTPMKRSFLNGTDGADGDSQRQSRAQQFEKVLTDQARGLKTEKLFKTKITPHFDQIWNLEKKWRSLWSAWSKDKDQLLNLKEFCYFIALSWIPTKPLAFMLN